MMMRNKKKPKSYRGDAEAAKNEDFLCDLCGSAVRL
jgi:hypothetical protein